MILDDIHQLEAVRDSSRTVIVGSGAVGLYAAHELSRRGRRVLVVESGGTGLGGFTPDDYLSLGRPHEGIRIGRSRTLGGTTNLWGGQLAEFVPVDIDGREWLPGSRWPISYEELSGSYRRAYENLGIAGEAQNDVPVLRNFLGSTPVFEEGLELFLTRWLKVPNFAVFYAPSIESDPRLGVLLNHTVVGFEASEGFIRAVRVVDRSGRVHRVEGACFLLAAGTIEISRLLLHAARSSDWDCPWRENPNLGTHFQDHLGGPIASVRPLDRRRFFDTFSTMYWSGLKYQPKLRLTNRTVGGERSLNVQGVFNFESSVEENLVYLKQFLKAALYSRRVSGVGDFFRNLMACRRYLVPLMWKYVVDNRIFVPSTSKVSLVVQSEQTPLAESRIRIDPTRRDAHGLPRAILEWRIGDEELKSIHDFARRCERALKQAGLAELRIAEDLANLRPCFLSTLCDTNHQAGGARMGLSARDGVVDRNLRVFGTRNLFVAGAATFPTSSHANTTFTALTLVTRWVDHLLSEHATD